MIAESIDFLGFKGADKVTGFAGVITTVSFDLYGCVQVAITPPMLPDGKREDSFRFDINRITLTNERVMSVPAFEASENKPASYTHGPAEKPAGSRNGIRG